MSNIAVKLLVGVVAVVVVFSVGSKLTENVRKGEMQPVISDIRKNIDGLKEKGKETKEIFDSLANLPTSTVATSNNIDSRLPVDALIAGIVVDGAAKAYYIEAIKQKGEVIDKFQDKTFVLRYNERLDMVRAYKNNKGKLERIDPTSELWFSWSIAHPDTAVFK